MSEPPIDEPLGVNVIGFLGEALGLGEAGRLYVSALQAAGVSVSTTAIRPDRDIRRDGSIDPQELVSATRPAFNLACVNADSLAALVAERGPGLLGGRPTIGQWGWETDVLPPGWLEASALVDEVWVYSRFVAENLGRLLPVPVVVVPPAIVTPVPDGTTCGIPDDGRFTFLCMLDLFSTPARKNPAGVIDAFRRAFVPGEGPRLVVKTLNGQHRPAAAAELVDRAGGRADIEFLDGYLSPGAKAGLLARADCFVSLHRSEGFGLGLAESMALGTPVVATAYSGNMDFTSPANSWLVDWTRTRVGPDCEVYPPDGHWAEPDLDDAVRQLRRVAAEPERAAQRAARARADIASLYAPAVAGAHARARLELLDEHRVGARSSRRGMGQLSRLGAVGARAKRRILPHERG